MSEAPQGGIAAIARRGFGRVRSPAAAVAAGIFGSRIVGLLRVRAFSYFFGLQSDAADAFNAAFRIPNLLQNLFGEGALSGSFIPVYSGLRARGRTEEAAQAARTIFALLALAVAVLSLAGVLARAVGDRRAGARIRGREARADDSARPRILFPGAGLLVLSAWCLGVLNVHGRFLLSYAAPIAWNIAMIGTLLVFGWGRPLPELAVYLAWGSVIGSLAQVAVQWRQAWTLSAGGLRLAMSEPVRDAIRNFGPVVASRGAVQLTAYIDTVIASLLPTGAVTGLTNTQLLYTLPVSLFGISISSAALPSISADAHQDDAREKVRSRVAANAARIAYFTVPSAVSFLALGDVLAATLLQTGRFTAADSRYVWGILAGAAVGLVASTTSRLYGVAHYGARGHEDADAIHDRAARDRDNRRLRRGGLAAAAAAFRSQVGRRGTDGVSRGGRLDRARAAAAQPHLARRQRLGAGQLHRAPLGVGAGRRRDRSRRLPGVAASAPRLTGVIILPIFGAIYLGATRAAGIPLLARA